MTKLINFTDKIDIELYNIFENLLCIDLEKKCLINNKIKDINYKQLYKRYMWLKQMNINPNEIHLNENHKLVYKIFDECNKMLNDNNIEYYYTSGILSYLLVNRPLERYHHDLDIFVNMSDLNKLEQLCSNYNFSFERKIGIRDFKTKRIMLKMYYNDIIDIPITLFMYVKNDDLSITQKDYFVNDDGDEYVEYVYNSPEISQLSFSDTPHFHNNIKYYSITLEALYMCKKGNRDKDIYDCNVFRNYVDKSKLKSLEDAYEVNFKNYIIDANNDEFYNFIFRGGRQKVLNKNERL